MNEKMYMGTAFCQSPKFIRYDIPSWCPAHQFCHNVTNPQRFEFSQSECKEETPNITNIDHLLKQNKYLREYQWSVAMKMSHLALSISLLSSFL
jgi:hypothetical protein